jgi:transposase
MESHSGNASDKVILHEAAKRMKAFCDKLKDAPSFLHVADSAMYDACLKEDGNLLWLSRVPETHKAAGEWLEAPDHDVTWTELERGYKICSRELKYRNIPQRWLMAYSEQAYNRESKTLEKRILKEQEEQKKLWWHLGNQLFQCESDAKKQAEKLKQKLLYHTVQFEIVPEKKYPGKGRPAKDAVEVTAGYRIKHDIVRHEEKIALILRRKGRFILATNQMDCHALSDAEMLSEYKGQSKTESGFRFIKDNTFEVSSVFLKKPERISALMMIMTLCLMVYGIAQHHLRESLDRAGDMVPDQTKKPTSRPTMKWIYRMFCNIQVIALEMEGHIREIVINVTEIHRKIIRYFGEVAMRIYEVSPA